MRKENQFSANTLCVEIPQPIYLSRQGGPIAHAQMCADRPLGKEYYVAYSLELEKIAQIHTETPSQIKTYEKSDRTREQ